LKGKNLKGSLPYFNKIHDAAKTNVIVKKIVDQAIVFQQKQTH
jgi:hypothetical protein